MKFSVRSLWLLILALLSVFSAPFAVTPAVGQEVTETEATEKKAPKGDVETEPSKQKPKQKYIRVTRNDRKKPTALETAIVRYKLVMGDKDVFVDLIGAVHIGDKDYYDALNKRFEQYDSLLYELVAPEGTKIPKGGRKGTSAHPVAAMQGGMQSLLDLEHQLTCVDYNKKNFVHADMSPEEFSKSMKEKGDGWMVMMFRMMGAGMAQQSKGPSDVEILMAMFAKDRAKRLKQIFAGQFENMEGTMAALEGKDGSTIISERNRKAFEVLKKELAAGKKKIGVFYGAGHLADMDRRLKENFKMEPVGDTTWLRAWKIDD